MISYKPWGELDWTLGLASPRQWSFLGCLGSEDRSVAALIRTQRLGVLLSNNHLMVRIRDVRPQDQESEDELCVKRIQECEIAGISTRQESYGLLDPMVDWRSCFETYQTENVILDISSMPKRFFFPFLKNLVLDKNIRNLFLTYTVPKIYDNGPLNGDPEDWDVIPGFRTDDPKVQGLASKRLVVNIGFMPEGLIEHLGEEDTDAKAHLIVPFPAPSRTVRRSWGTVKRLVGSSIHPIRHKTHRIGPQDMPEAFEKLVSISSGNRFPVALAPFGPKPISAAMCLFSTETGMPVYYSQPKTYSTSYSSGVGKILGYWVKLNGRNLYVL